MARYDATFSALAERAVKKGILDLEAFLKIANANGMSDGAIKSALERDLANDGPVFGAFMRSIQDASTSSVMAAASQGDLLGTVAEDAQLQRLVEMRGIKGSVIDAIDSADPALASDIENAVADQIPEMSVATLENTCSECLPLHGKVLSHAEWRARGLLPADRHAGWSSSCKCRLIPQALAMSRNEALAPLRRVKMNKGKGTMRAVTQADVDKAIAAADTAAKTPEGRATLERLGTVNG